MGDLSTSQSQQRGWETLVWYFRVYASFARCRPHAAKYRWITCAPMGAWAVQCAHKAHQTPISRRHDL